MIRELYRTILPEVVRKYLWTLRFKKLRADIIRYLRKKSRNGDEECQRILTFLEAHKDLHIVFPYDFTEKYSASNISVFHDETGFPYVLHNGKKLYGKKKWTDSQFAEYYCGLLLEQDEESPHRYLFPNRMPQKDSVIADVGAAEGIFTLDVLPCIQKAYLFECDKEWIEALHLTFKEEIAGDVVEIVEAFVGSEDNAGKNTVRLDSFFADKRIDYIKADIEGAEEAMIAGGESVFSQKVQTVLLCCYHKQNAEDIFKQYLVKKGFSHIEVNQKWMIFVYQEETLRAPYLRHGVMYAKR